VWWRSRRFARSRAKACPQLTVVWTAHTGEVSDITSPGRQNRKGSVFENTPILVDGALYITTPFNRVLVGNPLTRGARRMI
jgi:quinoprotein glucose dehydrogenase